MVVNTAVLLAILCLINKYCWQTPIKWMKWDQPTAKITVPLNLWEMQQNISLRQMQQILQISLRVLE